jgi:hypothetical protein
LTHSGHRPEGWAHRRRTRDHAASVNHAQRGDPAKLAKAIMRLVEAPNLPTRLPLGSDTVERIEAKHALVERELAAWRPVAVSTDWTDGRA